MSWKMDVLLYTASFYVAFSIISIIVSDHNESRFANFIDHNGISPSDLQFLSNDTKMNLNCVLTATDLTVEYVQFIPYFIDAWRLVFRDQVKPFVVLIADNMNELSIDKKYWKHIRIFSPITNVSTKFTAQYIRILYPSLMEKDCHGGILISDIDMIPLNKEYHVQNINKYSINSFIYYRNNLYNIATSKTWQQINHIANTNDIMQKIISIFDEITYDNEHHKDLYKLVLQWNESKPTNRFIKGKDEYFRRLNRTNMKINNEIINILSNAITTKTNKFYFVTYASKYYWKRLLNFIGSVHFWMPSNQIVVYDLGLNAKQRQTLSTFCNIIYEKFPFQNYPIFIKQHLRYYAWQPLILSLASHKYKNILMQDAGQELRQNIMFLLYDIYENGYFFTQRGCNRKLIHNGTAKYLNITTEQHLKYMKMELQGGIVGISLNNNLVKDTKQEIITFLDKYSKCAVIEECIAPNGSTLENHRYSQAVQTILIQHLFNWTQTANVKKSRQFWESRKIQLTTDEKETNDVMLMSRRGKWPKPYKKYLKSC